MSRLVILMFFIRPQHPRGFEMSEFSGAGVKFVLIDFVRSGVRHVDILATAIKFDAMCRSFRDVMIEVCAGDKIVRYPVNVDFAGGIVRSQSKVSTGRDPQVWRSNLDFCVGNQFQSPFR